MGNFKIVSGTDTWEWKTPREVEWISTEVEKENPFRHPKIEYYPDPRVKILDKFQQIRETLRQLEKLRASGANG
jgi:hypothetical protein